MNKDPSEQALCDDAISRQAVLDMMQMRISGKELYKAVYKLPPVTPQKIGHWKRISIDKYSEHAKYWYRCDRCGEDNLGDTDWCPNCGCRMG